MNKKVQTVLFDIDGTLNDSNDAHAGSWVDALAEAGRNVAFERVRPFIGMGSDKMLPEIAPGLSTDREPGKTITARRKEIFLERYLADVKPFAGARELVAAVRARGLRCIVASSASEQELDPLLRIAGVHDLFDHAMTPDEVKSTKPDPDIIVAALAWSKTAPEQTVMVGDSRFDIEAATRAGVRSIGLRCGGSSDDALAGATAIYDTPAALRAALEGISLDALLDSAPAREGRSGRAQ